MLRVRVLGAAAGGGLPQWNCACEGCRAARSRTRGVSPQTQSSIAVSGDGERWVLFNASPDLRSQIEANAPLHPRPAAGAAPRHTPIEAVVLTNADLDHVAGLLTLRERQSFSLCATPEVHSTLAQNPIFGALSGDCVQRRSVKPDAPEAIPEARIEFRLFSVPGKVPLYLEGTQPELDLAAVGENTVAAEIRSLDEGGARAFYIPGCAALPDWLGERLRGAELVLFDGTVFRDDEMAGQRLGEKTGARMGHMAMSGPRGSLAAFSGLGVARKIFVHLNNSNPVWLSDSAERAAVLEAGWEVAYDGMDLVL